MLKTDGTDKKSRPLAMQLTFLPFTADLYPAYAAWFSDPELNHHLGPMDTDWLKWVLAHEGTDEQTRAVYRGDALVGVTEVVIDRSGDFPVAVISAVSVQPTLRGQGIGLEIMRQVIVDYHRAGIRRFRAQIALSNIRSLRLFARLGFAPASPEPDRNGFLRYVRASTASRCGDWPATG